MSLSSMFYLESQGKALTCLIYLQILWHRPNLFPKGDIVEVILSFSCIHIRLPENVILFENTNINQWSIQRGIIYTLSNRVINAQFFTITLFVIESEGGSSSKLSVPMNAGPKNIYQASLGGIRQRRSCQEACVDGCGVTLTSNKAKAYWRRWRSPERNVSFFICVYIYIFSLHIDIIIAMYYNER
jgi:hypothetical protein